MTTNEFDNNMPSKNIIDATPLRVNRFILAVAAVPEIDEALTKAGYSEEDLEEAWTLLRKLGQPRSQVRPSDPRSIAAIDELDGWDEPNFRRIEVVLDHHHPEQRAFVMDGLEPSTGTSAVVGVSILLDRLDALENAPEREATREADHAALATLAKRGYTPEERQRLRLLVQLAQKKDPVVIKESVTEAQRTDALIGLRKWWLEWSTTARQVIARRDHLIRLGLASRRKSEDENAPEPNGSGDPPPDAPIPQPTAPQ